MIGWTFWRIRAPTNNIMAATGLDSWERCWADMSTLFVDTINEKTSGNGISIPGHVIQVQKVGHSTHQALQGRLPADTGLQGSITPKFSNSLILIIVSPNVSTAGANSSENAVRLYWSAPTTATVQEIQRGLLFKGKRQTILVLIMLV